MSIEAIPVKHTEAESPHMMRWSLVIGSAFFATAFAQPQVLKLPFQYLLKTDLHASREKMAYFFAICSMAWNFKPIFGIISDSVPIFGTRRRHYIIFGSLAAGLAWMAIGFVPRTYTAILIASAIMGTMIAAVSTFAGGVVVEVGQRYGATGRLSSTRYFMENVAVLSGGLIGGYLAMKAFRYSVMTGAVVAASVAPFAYFFLIEPPVAQKNSESWIRAKQQLRTLMKSGPLWSAAGLLFLVYFIPGFQTPLYYYQTDTLKFSQQFIGTLAFLSGGVGLFGALLYGYVCRRMNLRHLLYLGTTMSAIGTLFYLFYSSRTAAMLIESQAGFIATVAELALMDLAARATPRGSESLGFSLMMSVRNIGIGVSDIVGSWLIDQHHVSFFKLVWLNAGTTALILFVIPFLPKLLIDRSDVTPGA